MLTGAFLLAAGMFTGCTDDLTELPGEADDSIYAVAEDEYALGITLSLSQLTGNAGTRTQIGGPLGNLAGGTGQGLKDIEEYVNTENLYVLFFDINGTFLFQIDKPVAVPIGQSESGNDSQWFIKIPVKQINDNLIRYIEENPFKIAVLANWTFDSDLNLGGNLSGWEEFRFKEPIDEQGNLVYDEFGKLKGDHISLFAHAQRDNVYENTTMHGYDHLVYRTETGPHMGPYTEWVANYHKSIDQADADIRAYFDVKNNIYQNPDNFFFDNNGIPTALDHFDTKYNNIWHVWNFGGNDASNFIFTMNEDKKKDWLELNQKAKDQFLETYGQFISGFYTTFASVLPPPPVVVPKPPVSNEYGNIIPLRWKMDNYSTLDFVIPYGYGNAIMSNYALHMDMTAILDELVSKFPNFPWDKLFSGEFYDDDNFYIEHGEELNQIEIAFIQLIYQNSKNFNGMVLTMPNITMSDHNAGNPLNLNGRVGEYDMNGIPSTSPTYVRFPAHADGYVRVNYKAYGGAKLYAHIGTNNTPENNASNYQRDNRNNRYIVDEDGFLKKEVGGEKQIADIPFDPKNVYLYMVADPDYKVENPDYDNIEPGEDGSVPSTKIPIPERPMIEIFGVEYIESRHLYDVDRRAILPSKDYPIPMYGVQDFDPIGEYWEPGLLFNLSQFNNAQKTGYNYRRISLLRSISRVEVKLLKSAFPQKPAHVYLRSMNRSARITPVDFFTPTDIIWNGFNSSSANDVKRLQNYIDAGNLNEQLIIESTPGVVQEEKNIMQYGPIYIGSNKNAGQSSAQKLTEYRKTTAWPFGIWEHQWDWDWNRGNGFVEDFETYKVGDIRAHTGQQVPEYPRILHTRISRSDYSHFAEVDNSNSEYWHYIIYIPEKNITDADNPGDIADRPKIIHVEIRFNGGPIIYDENGRIDHSHDEDNIVDNFDDKRAYRLYFTQGGRANLGSFNFQGRDSWDAYEYDWDIVRQHWPIIRNHVYTFTVNAAPDHVGSVDFTVNAPDIRNAYYEFN